MADIRIPDVFNKKLIEIDTEGNAERVYVGLFNDFLTRIKRILSIKDEYFPNYTDHGIEHINKVLKYSAKLIDKKTMEHLDTRSICVLLMAVLAHDIGMFIHYNGLKVILGEDEWAQKWEKYRGELGHMSDSRAEEIFGTYSRNGKRLSLHLPNANEIASKDETLIDNDWQKRLCGEFLRRHHHELAQYCVLNGFPISPEERLPLLRSDDMEDDSLINAVALVARSHGESMDANEALIEDDVGYSKSNRGFLYDVPIYLLMAAIRLADYLDAGAGRADWIKLAMSGSNSKLSQREFRWNQFVNINENHFKIKIKCIHIEVRDVFNKKPITGTAFQQIEGWMADVKREIDISWRYLYFMYEAEEEKSYKLSMRMLSSNIMDKQQRKQFSDRIVIEPASLSAAPEILGLLAEPLYGHDPSYGVRELLQNAVDACREREALEKNYSGKIRVIVDTKKEKSFRIIDNGIGMTQDVILKYFLKAGSSYRQSDEWKSDFGEKGVARVGQFGIGVLAAFLIGDSIRIATLPRGKERGFVFEIHKGAYKPIDISKAGKEEPRIAELMESGGGTVIDISVREEALERLSDPHPYSWYMLDMPEIDYRINERSKRNENKCADYEWLMLGCDDSGLSDRMKKTDITVNWRDNEYYLFPGCIYNGFAVRSVEYYRRSFGFEGNGAVWRMPGQIMVTDNHGKAAISIDRNSISLPPDIEKQLHIECLMLSLAKLITARINGDDLESKAACVLAFSLKHTGSRSGYGQPDFILSKQGLLINLPSLVGKANIQTLLLMGEKLNGLDHMLSSELENHSFCLSYFDQDWADDLWKSNVAAAMLLNERYGLPWSYKTKERHDDGIRYYARDTVEGQVFSDELIGAIKSNREIVGAIRFSGDSSYTAPEEVEEILNKYFELDSGKDPWIPYELAERKKKFPKFFDKDDIMYKKYMTYLNKPYMTYLNKTANKKFFYSLEEIERA